MCFEVLKTGSENQPNYLKNTKQRLQKLEAQTTIENEIMK